MWIIIILVLIGAGLLYCGLVQKISIDQKWEWEEFVKKHPHLFEKKEPRHCECGREIK